MHFRFPNFVISNFWICIPLDMLAIMLAYNDICYLAVGAETLLLWIINLRIKGQSSSKKDCSQLSACRVVQQQGTVRLLAFTSWLAKIVLCSIFFLFFEWEKFFLLWVTLFPSRGRTQLAQEPQFWMTRRSRVIQRGSRANCVLLSEGNKVTNSK